MEQRGIITGGGGGGVVPGKVVILEHGKTRNRQECLICGKLEVEERREEEEFGSRWGLNHFAYFGASGSTPPPADCDLVKAQLWAMFVLRRVLGLPEEECARLLQEASFGLNPNDWFDLCGECSGVVEQVLEMLELVLVLEGKMTKLRSGLKDKLEGSLRAEVVGKGSKEGEEESEVGVMRIRQEIRKYFKNQLGLQKRSHLRRRVAANHARRRRNDDDDSKKDSDYNDNLEGDPLWIEGDEDEDDDEVGKSSSPEVIKGRYRTRYGRTTTTKCTTTTTRRSTRSTRFHESDNHDELEKNPAVTPPINIYVCKDCGKAYNLQQDLVNHQAEKHAKREPGGDDDGQTKQTSLTRDKERRTTTLFFQCEQCDAKFDKIRKLARHRRSEHHQATRTCLLCKSEVRLKNYKRHLTACGKAHRKKSQEDGAAADDDDDPSDGKQFNCEKCGFLSAHRGNLNAHMRTHDYDDQIEVVKSGAFQCKVCSALFTNKFLIQRHLMEAHHAELGLTLHQCPDCGKMYGTAKTLNQHFRSVHSDRRRDGPVELTAHKTSATSTTTESDQSSRETTTTTVGPLNNNICTICGLHYSGRYLLNLHMRRFHRIAAKNSAKLAAEKERRQLKCNYCDVTSVNSFAMRLHWRTVHPELFKHRCDQCGYTSKSETLLSQHKRVKHQIRGKVKCPYCDQEYVPMYLYAHKIGCRKKLGITTEEETKTPVVVAAVVDAGVQPLLSPPE